jgi:predicted outer membrane protein
VQIGGPGPAGEPTRGLADALRALHSFFGAQTQAARTVTMSPTTGPVTELATDMTDQLKALDLQLTALAQRLGISLEGGGPLGATETAQTWAHEQRMLELQALRGRSLDAAFLAPLADDMRFGQGLVNAAKLSGTLDPDVLRFLNGAGVQLQSYLDRSRDLLSPRLRVATTAERERG